MFIQRGDKVMVGGKWYPVIGLALTSHPDGPPTGSIFTDKPRGNFEAGLGYRIDYAEVEKVRCGDLSKRENELYEALLAATAALAGATSAYQFHAARHRSVGRSKPDPFFLTRIKDFEKATEAARAILMKYAGPA